MNSRATATLAGAVILVLSLAPARADHQPVIVVPGKPGVPVPINGVDATGAAVYGDWGLYRAGHGSVVIEGAVGPDRARWPGGYFPATGHMPRYGRHEILPPPGSAPPRPAPDYYRGWSAGSEPGPVTEYPPFD